MANGCSTCNGVATSNLTDCELALINEELPLLLTITCNERQIQLDAGKFRSAVVKACEVAKAELQRPFGGMNCSPSEFGWTIIRPEDVNPLSAELGNTGATDSGRRNWDIDLQAVPPVFYPAWINYWVRTQSNGPVELVNFCVDEEALLLVLGVIELSPSPVVTAVKMTTEGQEGVVYYIEDQTRLGDIPICLFPVPKLIQNEHVYSMRIKVDVQLTQQQQGQGPAEELQLFGIKFAKYSELRKELPIPGSAPTQ